MLYSETIEPERQTVFFTILALSFIGFIAILSLKYVEGVKFVIKFLVPDKPETAIILEKRHKYIIERMLTKFNSTKSF